MAVDSLQESEVAPHALVAVSDSSTRPSSRVAPSAARTSTQLGALAPFYGSTVPSAAGTSTPLGVLAPSYGSTVPSAVDTSTPLGASAPSRLYTVKNVV